MTADGMVPARAVVVTATVERPDDSPGAIAVLLDHLDRRRVASTWFVREDVDRALVDRLWFTGHEVAGAIAALTDIRAVVDALRAHEVEIRGARVIAAPDGVSGVPDLVEQTAATGLAYLSVPRGLIETLELPTFLEEAALAVLPAPPVAPGEPQHPLAWLQTTQLAIGRVLEHGGLHELNIDATTLDRPDALSAVMEAIDLVSGLARAERLWLGRLDRFVTETVATGRR